MELLNTEFKRLFSTTLYKSLKLKLADMSFAKDFINDRRGDLYPLLHSTEDCRERVEHHRYLLSGGAAERFFCAFFPYATYEVEAESGASS